MNNLSDQTLIEGLKKQRDSFLSFAQTLDAAIRILEPVTISDKLAIHIDSRQLEDKTVSKDSVQEPAKRNLVSYWKTSQKAFGMLKER